MSGTAQFLTDKNGTPVPLLRPKKLQVIDFTSSGSASIADALTYDDVEIYVTAACCFQVGTSPTATVPTTGNSESDAGAIESHIEMQAGNGNLIAFRGISGAGTAYVTELG